MASDIQLSVELKPGDVKQAASQLQAEIESIFNANVNEKLQVSFARLQQSMQKAYQSAESIKQEMNSLEGTKVETPYMKNLQNDMIAARDELGKLQERMEKFKETGGKTTSRAFKGMQYEAGRLEKQIADIKAERESVKSMGEQFMPAEDTARYQQLVEKLAQVNNQMRIYSMRAREIVNKSAGPKTGTISSWEKLRGTIQKATAALRKFILARLGLSKGSRSLSGIFSGLNGGLSNFTGGLKKGFWTVMKYAFGLRSLFIVTNKVRNALKDGIKNLVQYSSSFNHSISNMLSSLNYLKNSLATAFEPLLTTVAPILVKFIDTIANALSKVSQFFSALMGRGFYYKAKKVYQDYAASLSDVGGSAGSAKDKVEELKKTIAGFDDVEILKGPDTDSSGGGGGGGAGGGGVTPADMFETLPVTEKFKNLAEMLKEAWANSDFTEIGRMLGEKVRDALNSIDWEPIKKGAEKIAKVTATFINGYFETPGLWEAVGRTIGEGINTGLTFVDTFLKTIHTDSIGRAITTTISNTFKTIDWSLVGSTVSHAFARLFDFIRGLIEGIDWSNLPYAIVRGIRDFFTGFDWASFFQSLGALIAAALKAGIQFAIGSVNLVNILIQWIGKQFKQRIKKFKDAGKSPGEAIVLGILQGIKDALKSIGKWIKKNILDPFIKGFKDAFGIHSPSKVMKEYGKDIIQGMLDGMLSLLRSIGSWIKEHILTPILNALDPRSLFEKGKEFASNVKNGISNAKSTLQTAGANIKSWIREKLTAAGFDTDGKSMASKVSAGITNAKSILQTAGANIKAWIKEKVTNSGFETNGNSIATKVISGISSAKTLLQNAGSNLKSWIKERVTSSDFNVNGQNMATQVHNGIVAKQSLLQKAGGYIKSWVKDNANQKGFNVNGQNMGTQVNNGIVSKANLLRSVGSNMASWVRNNVSTSGFYSIGKNMTYGISDGVNAAKWALVNAGNNIASAFKKTIKNIFGIRSPSRVMRDEVGKMLVAGIAVGVDSEQNSAIKSATQLANSINDAVQSNLNMPDITSGKVIPYEVEISSKSNLNSIAGTLNNLIEMLEYNRENQISRDELEQMITNIVQRYMNIDFYIGDEQVARHANAGNEKLNRRFNPVMA